MKNMFMEYIDKAAREWWETLPKQDTHPFHATQISWSLIPEPSKWGIYGMYIDDLRGIGLSEGREELIQRLREDSEITADDVDSSELSRLYRLERHGTCTSILETRGDRTVRVFRLVKVRGSSSKET